MRSSWVWLLCLAQLPYYLNIANEENCKNPIRITCSSFLSHFISPFYLIYIDVTGDGQIKNFPYISHKRWKLIHEIEKGDRTIKLTSFTKCRIRDRC